jgi:hypothetical protein
MNERWDPCSHGKHQDRIELREIQDMTGRKAVIPFATCEVCGREEAVKGNVRPRPERSGAFSPAVQSKVVGGVPASRLRR